MQEVPPEIAQAVGPCDRLLVNLYRATSENRSAAKDEKDRVYEREWEKREDCLNP